MEDDEYDSVDSALENRDKGDDTTDDDQEGSAEHKASTRGKVITDTMDDIAQAALGKTIEKKSDIIHSLPSNYDDSSSSGEKESTVAPSNDGKERSGTALKNLFTALADGQTSSSGSGEDSIAAENPKSNVAQRDDQVSINSSLFAPIIEVRDNDLK